MTSTWIGQTLEGGRFVVHNKLGEGGMAVVYRATDLNTAADVVIKVPKQNALEDVTFLKRFARENQTLSRLKHPHVVPILHVGEQDGWPFTVLKYLSGGDLDLARKSAKGKLSLQNLTRWLPEIASALDFIHQNGYLHRDVKPANILFDGDGQSYLGDFGIAKVVSEAGGKATRLTGTGMVIGTPDYMAPELILERPYDGRVDQYALGMTVYECLAGRLPFDAQSAAAILVQQTTAAFPPPSQFEPSIPPRISAMILRSLSKKPEARYPNCLAFAREFVEIVKQPSHPSIPLVKQPLGKQKPPQRDTNPVGPPPLSDRNTPLHSDPPTATSLRPPPLPPAPPTPPAPPERHAPKFQGRGILKFLSLGIGMVLGCGLLIYVISSLTRKPVPEMARTEKSVSPDNPETSPDDSDSTPAVTESQTVIVQPAAAVYGEARRVVGGAGIEFALISAGTFTMGSPPTETGRATDEGQVTVTLTQPFYLGTHEVTQKQWEEVMGTTPWQGQILVNANPDHAASYISWNDATAFCAKLTQMDLASGKLPSGWMYTLPTEAQWEYACRGGTSTRFSFGNDETELDKYAWFRDNALALNEQHPHPVGQKQPNPFGLFDMHGNVWEWCRDWYRETLPGGSDPEVLTVDAHRVNRGGSWSSTVRLCRSATRDWGSPDYRISYLGFRVAAVQSDQPVFGQTSQIKTSTNIELKLIPAGTFTMGSPVGEAGRDPDEDQVSVTLTKPFYIGTHEITQKQWEDVMGTTPWQGQLNVNANPNHAASYISYDDADTFCKALTARERAAGRMPADWSYALPTEAQWEYACRGSMTTRFSFGDAESSLSNYAWYNSSAFARSEQYPHEVGQKQPNAFGLYDMHGNVAEWCRDWYSSRLPGGTDPEQTTRATFRVNRGGSWISNAQYCRSANRDSYSSSSRYGSLGFRLAAIQSTATSSTATTSTTPPLPAFGQAKLVKSSTQLELALIPAGSFFMGSPSSETERSNNEDQVSVRISNPFYMGTHEVTQKQWEDVMGTTPWKNLPSVVLNPDHAANHISWDDAMAFCRQLTQMDRTAGTLPANWSYTLPTEAQWEYACRAGTTTRYSFGDTVSQLGNYAWFRDNAYDLMEQYPHAVGQKRPNAFGLYDMHGNVWEWCRDWYSEKLPGGIDPEVTTPGTSRVYRGGSWYHVDRTCRSASRYSTLGERYIDLGFRIAAVQSTAAGK